MPCIVELRPLARVRRKQGRIGRLAASLRQCGRSRHLTTSGPGGEFVTGLPLKPTTKHPSRSDRSFLCRESQQPVAIDDVPGRLSFGIDFLGGFKDHGNPSKPAVLKQEAERFVAQKSSTDMFMAVDSA